MSDDVGLEEIPEFEGDLPENILPVKKEESLAEGYTHYTKKRYLKKKGGQLLGRWGRSFTDACIEGLPWGTIELDSVISRKRRGKCSDSGDLIIKVRHD